jgi:hypothetical protein
VSAALAGRVEGALSSLDEAERQALAMRERDGADYRAIAEKLGTGREGVADLIVGARLAVASQLHGEPPPPRRTQQCGPARRVLAAQADGEAVGPQDLERAREHIAGCEPCAAARLALREAELACRAWSTTPLDAPPPPPVSPRSPYRGNQATRTIARRRLIAAAVGLVLLVAILVAALSGGGDTQLIPAAPSPGPGSAQGSGKDVVTPPGDKFCPDNRTSCK